MLYSQSYLLQKPPKSIKNLEVWKYVVNKMTNNGENKISIGGVIKYYHTKINYLNKQS